MTQYRRIFVPGATFFFTARLYDLRQTTLTDHIGLLRDAVRVTRKQLPFVIDAAVVLPNQTHMIWTMPPGDADFSKRWRVIKSSFSRHVPAPAYVPRSLQKRREKGIWQRRFWEHMIRDADDYETHLRMIDNAPVVQGLVRDPRDWPYSSFNKRRQTEPA